MSINWVMLSADKQNFTPLLGEQLLYTSPLRTSLSIQSLNKQPGKEPFSHQSSTGRVFLTNRRIVYLPANASPALESFAAPILHLHDTHVAAPFFGPNVWTALVQPVPGGNIPPEHAALELKMTFKDGGAYDFHSTFERIKERLQQAVDIARESGHLTGDGTDSRSGIGGGGLSGVNLDSVHLDQLPAYEDATSLPSSNPTGPREPVLGNSGRTTGLQPRELDSRVEQRRRQRSVTPPTQPPRYEDVQRDSVADELERRLRVEQ